MTNPKISVIMPVYNGEKYITQAIESVLAQTYKNFEIIIVNDGSTDSSFEKIKPYLSLPNIKYIEQENRGVAAARNTGIKNSSGELIGFLDQDDLWLPEKLELQVEFFKKHPEVGLVHARQSYINENGESLTGRGKWLKGISGECFEELFRENCIAVLTVVFKRECLNKIELFNERLAGVDDYEMWLKISKLYPLGYVDQILAKYRMHSSNAHRHYLKMGLMELDAINSILSVFPNLSNDIGKETVTSRLFELYHKTGKLYLWINRDFKNANRYFWKASKKRPFHLENIKYLIWYSMNASKRKTLSWYWYKIRKNFV